MQIQHSIRRAFFNIYPVMKKAIRYLQMYIAKCSDFDEFFLSLFLYCKLYL